MSPLKILSEAEKIFYCRMVHILLLGTPTRMLYMLTGGWETVYMPAVQNNTISADTGSAHKLYSVLPKFLSQTSLFSLQK